jgi:pilus assembly protein CpaB
MSKRLVAAAAAVLLALVGTGVLLSYVQGADARAQAGTTLVDVVVAKATIPTGTTGDTLGGLVEVRSLPQSAVVPGALTSASAVAGQVSSAEIEAGEQVLASRFAPPGSTPGTSSTPGGTAVPAGMITTSVLLEPQRALGGAVTTGETVSVFISQKGTVAVTHLQLHSVLVTAVGGAPAPTTDASPSTVSPAAQTNPLPATNIMVTLALTPPNAEKLVWAAEHGSIWLAAEPAGTPAGGTSIVDPSTVYK